VFCFKDLFTRTAKRLIFFTHANCAISYFNCELIVVLKHISFVLYYRCRGVWALGSNE